MAFDKGAMGKALQERRKEAGMTQMDLASAAGMSSVNLISKYETGSMIPGEDKVWDMAVALGCSPNEILGWPKQK